MPDQDGTPPRRWLYADKPLSDGDADTLEFSAYADALALLMDLKDTLTPLTIAINGPWGSGKTSLAEMAEARLPVGSDWGMTHVICKFDAWANDDAPHLGAAFAAAVAKAVNRQRHWWVRLVLPLPSVMLRPEQRWRRRLWLALLALALAAAATFWPTKVPLLTSLLHPGKTVSGLGHGTAAARLVWPALVVAVIALARQLGPGVQAVARWIDDPRSEAARGSMQDASRQLGQLIKQALRGKRRLIIFVDNLERCRPPRAVEVCEVVSQLIGHPDVVTVLIGDMDTIALSAEIKYAALETAVPGKPGMPAASRTSGKTGNGLVGSYGRAYLEKLIQIELRLPPPLPKGLQEMLVPVPGERPAFPMDARRSGHGLAAKVKQGIVLIEQPKRWALAAASLATLAVVTAATFGADVVLSVASIAGAALTAIVQRYVEGYRERREDQKRQAIDTVVNNMVEPTETTLRLEEEITEEVEQRIENVDVREIRRRMRQRIISQNDLRSELDRAVLDVLPPSPRGAKRMFNHAHLMLDIGVERGLFTAQTGLQASQLAVWVALTERWPSVAAAITSDPSIIGRLEEAIRRTSLIGQPEQLSTMEAEIGITGLDSCLLNCLRRTESLAPVARLLANFSSLAKETPVQDRPA
jgi:hypothetical protein